MLTVSLLCCCHLWILPLSPVSVQPPHLPCSAGSDKGDHPPCHTLGAVVTAFGVQVPTRCSGVATASVAVMGGP